MRKTFIVLLILSSALKTNAQDNHKPLETKFEANLHLLGTGISYEFSLINQLAVQANINYDMSVYYNPDNISTISSTNINLEPRFYYNYNKRNRKNKNTKWNAANYISLNLGYLPNIKNSSNMAYDSSISNQVSITPMWNLRRNIGSSNFNYETGIGLSFDTTNYKYLESENTLNLVLNIKIGYNFKI